MTRRLIAVGQLTIVSVAGYELAVLDGEDVGKLVEAADSSIEEMEDL